MSKSANYITNLRSLNNKVNTINLLNSHKATHIGLKLHKCGVEGCREEYATAASLKYHSRVVHNGPGYVECETCNKTFVNLAYVKCRTVIHTKIPAGFSSRILVYYVPGDQKNVTLY